MTSSGATILNAKYISDADARPKSECPHRTADDNLMVHDHILFACPIQPTIIMSTKVDVPALLSELSLEEKISLLAGVDWWRTPVIKRDNVFVPHIKVKWANQLSCG